MELWVQDVGRDFNMAAERGPLAVTIINGVAYTGHRRAADLGIEMAVMTANHPCSQQDRRQRWTGRRLLTTSRGVYHTGGAEVAATNASGGRPHHDA